MTAPADSYLSFILSRPPFEVLNIFLLGMARVVPCIAFAPFLGGKILPNPMKVGFGVAVTFIFLPYLVGHTPGHFGETVPFILLLVKEAIIGSILGFFVSIPFLTAQSAGTLIDHQRGAQSLQVMNPATQTQASPLGTLYNDIMLVIFFSIGGPILFFDGIFSSYTVIPIDSYFSAEFFNIHHPVWVQTIQLCTEIFRITIQLSAPSILAMLLSDLFLGIANRMAPQVQISFLLWSLKAFIGIAMVFLSWAFVLKQLTNESHIWIKLFLKMIHRL